MMWLKNPDRHIDHLSLIKKAPEIRCFFSDEAPKTGADIRMRDEYLHSPGLLLRHWQQPDRRR